MKVSGRSKIEELKWFLFVMPVLIFYLVFFIIPACRSVFYSFTDWDGITSSYIGAKNFTKMLTDFRVLTAFKNTLMYAFFITVIQNVGGLILALLLDKKLKSVNLLRMLIFMPYIFSTLVVGYIWGFILEPNIGIINNIFGLLHLGFLQLDWLGNAALARWMIILVTIWQCAGYTMVIYISGLQVIPNELFESAAIDGAAGFKKFRHITFPMLASSFTINILLSTIGCLQLFNQIFALTGGGPGYATQSAATIIYTIGFGPGSKWGYGTAIALVLFILILILTAILVPLLRKREVEL